MGRIQRPLVITCESIPMQTLCTTITCLQMLYGVGQNYRVGQYEYIYSPPGLVVCKDTASQYDCSSSKSALSTETPGGVGARP